MAGLGVEVVFKGGLLAAVGFGVGALGAVAGYVGGLDKAPADRRYGAVVYRPRSSVYTALVIS